MTTPTKLSYDGSRAFNRPELVLLWLVLFGLPLIALFEVAGAIHNRDRMNLLLQARRSLAEEMDAFRNDLDPASFIRQKMRVVDRKFGFQTVPLESSPPKNLQPLSAESIQRLRVHAQHALQGNIFALFLHGPDTREVVYDFRPAGKPVRLSGEENLRDIFIFFNSQFNRQPATDPGFVRELFTRYTIWDGIHFERQAQERLREIFGTYFRQKVGDKDCLSFFSKEFGGGFFYAYYSLSAGRDRFLPRQNFGGYLVVVREEEIKPHILLDWALRTTRMKGMERRVSSDQPVSQPGFLQTDAGLIYRDLFPQSTLTYLRHVLSATTQPELFHRFFGGETPSLAVFIPNSALTSPLHEALAMTRVIAAGLFVASLIFLLRCLLFGLDLPLRLGGKINLAVGYALLFPLIGLGLAVTFSFRFYDMIYPEEVMDRLDRDLNSYVAGMDLMELFLGFRQKQLRDRLAAKKVMDLPGVKREVAKWLIEGGELEGGTMDFLRSELLSHFSGTNATSSRAVENTRNFVLGALGIHHPKENDAAQLSDLLSRMNGQPGEATAPNLIDLQILLKRMVWEKAVPRSLQCFFQNGVEFLGEGVIGDPNPENNKNSFERGISQEKLTLMNAMENAPYAKQERGKLQVATMHSLMDPFLGAGWSGEFFRNEGILCTGLMSTVQFKFSLATLYARHERAPFGVILFRYFPLQVSWAYLNFLRLKPGHYSRHTPEYKLDYILFALPANLSEELKPDMWSENPSNPLLLRKRAEEARTLKVNRRWNLLETPEKALYVSRIYKNHPHIGVGRALLKDFPGRNRIFVGWFLLGFPLLLIGVAAWLLRRSFVAPIQVFAELAKNIGRGHLSTRLQMDRTDEIGEMAQALNHMADGLQERERMTRFVSEDVIRAVAADGTGNLEPGGELCEASVLFSHIRDFHSLMNMHPPEELVEMLNAYFTEMEQCIRQNGGTIDKFIGDAVMAVFRRETEAEPHSIRACLAALRMRDALSRFNHKRIAAGGFAIETGIGIAGGDVISGRIGSDTGRLDFTVIGNTVNLAARLEAESKKARVSNIILAPSTIHMLKGRARVAFVERVDIKGRSRRFPLYELIGMR
jgi:class 3 adenylate cyclase